MTRHTITGRPVRMPAGPSDVLESTRREVTPLRIAFFGSSLVSAYWNGAATYYRGIIRALHAEGHCVTFYEPDILERQTHRDMGDPEWATVRVYEAPDAAAVRRVLDEAAADADVIVKASGVGAYDDLLEEAALRWREQGRVVVFWDVDAPATLGRVATDPDDSFLPLVPQYDAVLTYGGGRPVIERYHRLGARLCVPVCHALDPDTHHPVEPDDRYACDLAFLGNRLPDREARVDEFFFRAAELLPQRRFMLGGSGWEGKPMPRNVACCGHIYTHQHNAYNCSPLAVLNISRLGTAELGFSPATRVFEAAGAGACLITDAWEGIELFLEPGLEVLVAEDGQAVAHLLEHLTPEHARDIGAAARRRILSEHTYAHRARHLSGLLDDLVNRREVMP